MKVESQVKQLEKEGDNFEENDSLCRKGITMCKHKKQYSNSLLMSNPPKILWICLECGEKGTEIKILL
ncbi:hypothetical protein OCA00_01355 [Bacillus cereus]|nr:hypothetical protein [Bacillus cereus]MCU4853154.1 hypothetical protein [Bacillus cereus]MCU4869864.1 hypothetical protein [Bacillus cereus]MCU4938179.1 hypothetical protein [Bacillus cereus]